MQRWKSSENSFCTWVGWLWRMCSRTLSTGYERTYDTYDDYLKKKVPAHVVGILMTGEKKMFYDTDKEFMK